MTLFFVFSSCTFNTGEELAKLAINKISENHEEEFTKNISLELEKDDFIYVWSDLDVTYTGNLDLRFLLEISKDSLSIGVLEIDPTVKDITTNEFKTVNLGKTNWKFKGRNSKFKIKETGKYSFKGILIELNKHSELKISKAEIILKK